MSEKGIIGYKLVPITEDYFSGMQPATPSNCLISGINISGSGANKNIISKQTYDFLRYGRASSIEDVKHFVRTKVQEYLKEENKLM